MTADPARDRRSSQEGQNESHSRPTTAGDTSQQYAQYPASGYDFLSLDPNLGQHPPATPPYRRIPTASTTDVRAMPPDYRSEYNVSREHVGSNDAAGASRANLADEKSDYPREKPSLDDDERRDEREPPSQYNTATTGKSVHYPDTDGVGRLHNTPRLPQTGMPPRPTPSRQSSYAGSDMDDDEEEMYDWSDEEDLVDQEAKFHKTMGQGEKKKGFSFFRFLTFFFSTLIGSTLLSGALVAAAICVRLFWLKPHRTEHRQYVTDNIQAWLFWASANVTISWCLASIIDILPHIFSFLVVVVWGTLSEEMKSKLELYQNGKGWIKPLFYAACSWVSWVILFEGIFNLYDGKDEAASRAHYTPRVYQVIRFLFFLVLVVCLEKMLIQMIAFSFHRTAYQERLDEVSKATKVLDHLRDYKPRRRTPTGSGTHTPLFFGGRQRFASEPGAMEEGFVNGGDAADDERDARRSDSPALPPRKKRGFWAFSSGSGSGSGRSKPKRKDSNIPLQDSPTHAYPPSRAASGRNSPAHGSDGRRTPGGRHSRDGSGAHESGEAVILQAAKALKKVALHDARGMRKGDDDDEDGGGGGVFSLNSAHEAKKLARNLYYAFRSDRKRQYLIPSDFYPAYATADEARDAFRVFDKDDNGDITRAEIKTAVMKVYKERRFLARSLRDVGAAVQTLDRLMLCVFLIILIFIALPIFGVSISSSFSSIYTVFIAASFIFKNAASNAFDSIMFLFVTHPFDTGDRCFIDSENLVVRKMGLFATTFTRADGTQTYYFNSMLLTKFIMNARRSDKMGEVMEMQINWRTPQWKLDALEKKLNEWIDSDEKRWYKPGTSLAFSKIEFQKALFVNIGIGHNGTWQDWTMRLARKTAFHAAVQYFARQLEITCSESPQPVILTPESKYPHLDESQMDEPVTPHTPFTPHTPHTPTTPAVPNAPAVPSDLHREHAMLGFTPPQGKNLLRHRKGGNKKKLMGADFDG